MVLENNEPQVYVQVNAIDPWVCGPEPMGVLCSHEWATVNYVTNCHGLILFISTISNFSAHNYANDTHVLKNQDVPSYECEKICLVINA